MSRRCRASRARPGIKFCTLAHAAAISRGPQSSIDMPVAVALDDGEPGRVARRSFSMAITSARQAPGTRPLSIAICARCGGETAGGAVCDFLRFGKDLAQPERRMAHLPSDLGQGDIRRGPASRGPVLRLVTAGAVARPFSAQL